MVPSPSPRARSAISLGRYAIVRKLGSGSAGTVYLVRDRRVDREVALKVLRTDRISPDAVEKLQEEFRSFAGLHHPHIAAAHDFGYTGIPSVPFYTRESIEGDPLPAGNNCTGIGWDLIELVPPWTELAADTTHPTARTALPSRSTGRSGGG
jgi:serine/threonine protein kinase